MAWSAVYQILLYFVYSWVHTIQYTYYCIGCTHKYTQYNDMRIVLCVKLKIQADCVFTSLKYLYQWFLTTVNNTVQECHYISKKWPLNRPKNVQWGLLK